MYEIDELRKGPQFKTLKVGLFEVVATTFSRTLKKFRRVHVYELTRSFSRIVKKLLTGMRMITMDLDSTVTPVYVLLQMETEFQVWIWVGEDADRFIYSE